MHTQAVVDLIAKIKTAIKMHKYGSNPFVMRVFKKVLFRAAQHTTFRLWYVMSDGSNRCTPSASITGRVTASSSSIMPPAPPKPMVDECGTTAH